MELPPVKLAYDVSDLPVAERAMQQSEQRIVASAKRVEEAIRRDAIATDRFSAEIRQLNNPLNAIVNRLDAFARESTQGAQAQTLLTQRLLESERRVKILTDQYDRLNAQVDRFRRLAREASNAPLPGGTTTTGGARGIPGIPGLPGVAGVLGIGGILGGASVVGGIRSSIATVTEFEDAIAELGGVARASERDLESMQTRIREIAEVSRFSANEVAGGATFLARAGFSPREIEQSLESTLRLAQATRIGVDRAGDIASNVLTTFRLLPAQFEDVGDAIVTVTNRTNTSVEQAAEALKLSGASFAQTGETVEDALNITGIAGNVGIQGSLAGTGARGAFNALLSPSAQQQAAQDRLGLDVSQLATDSQQLADVFEELNEKGATYADLLELFDRRSANFVAAGVNQVDLLRELEQAQEENTGALATQAETLDRTLGASFDRLSAAIEEIQISAGEGGLSPVVRGLVDTTTRFVQLLNGDDIETWGDRALVAINPVLGAFRSLNSLADELSRTELLRDQQARTGQISAVTEVGQSLERVRELREAVAAAGETSGLEDDAEAARRLREELQQTASLIENLPGNLNPSALRVLRQDARLSGLNDDSVEEIERQIQRDLEKARTAERVATNERDAGRAAAERAADVSDLVAQINRQAAATRELSIEEEARRTIRDAGIVDATPQQQFGVEAAIERRRNRERLAAEEQEAIREENEERRRQAREEAQRARDEARREAEENRRLEAVLRDEARREARDAAAADREARRQEAEQTRAQERADRIAAQEAAAAAAVQARIDGNLADATREVANLEERNRVVEEAIAAGRDYEQALRELNIQQSLSADLAGSSAEDIAVVAERYIAADRAFTEFTEAQQRARRAQAEQISEANRASLEFVSIIDRAIDAGENFGSVFVTSLIDIGRAFASSQAANALSSLFGGDGASAQGPSLLSSLGGALGFSAFGNVFTGAGGPDNIPTQYNAFGAIVNRPTFGGFSGGAAQVFGENGPELLAAPIVRDRSQRVAISIADPIRPLLDQAAQTAPLLREIRDDMRNRDTTPIGTLAPPTREPVGIGATTSGVRRALDRDDRGRR